MDIYYVNSRNEKIDFKKKPYRTRTTNFMDNKWEFTIDSERVKSLNKKPIERKLEIDVMAKDREMYHKALNQLTNIIDYDNSRNQKGRLYVNDHYVNCNLIASEKSMWESAFPLLQNTLSILIEYPMWIKEKTFNFYPSMNTKGAEGQKKYTYVYPYVYGGSGGTSTLSNSSVISADIIVRIFGPVSSPAINMGANLYQVFADIDAGERLEIDTHSRTIFLIKEDGTKLRMFDKQNRTYDVFKKLQEGAHDVFWNDSFKFDVIVLETRSEPAWR